MDDESENHYRYLTIYKYPALFNNPVNFINLIANGSFSSHMLS